MGYTIDVASMLIILLTLDNIYLIMILMILVLV